MEQSIVKTVHCIDNLYLLEFSLAPEGTPGDFNQNIRSDWNFDPILVVMEKEGFAPGTEEDFHLFQNKCKGICRSNNIIMLGASEQCEGKNGYVIMSRAHEGYSIDMRERLNTFYDHSIDPRYKYYLATKKS